MTAEEATRRLLDELLEKEFPRVEPYVQRSPNMRGDDAAVDARDDERSAIDEFIDRMVAARLFVQGTGPRPVVVTVCGSTRFRAEMAEAVRELTLAGRIVLAPGVFAHDGDAVTEEQKQALDALHLKKIDLSDEVLVVDPGGYVGESTAREIAYAEETGKPVTRTSRGGAR